MAAYSFVTYDVFTDTRFTGNPLAVVFDADALDTAAMQRVAREFNLSETVFVRAPANAQHAASVRIFTPGTELPFAGHPTIGAAIAIAEAQRGGAATRLLVLEEKIGAVRCTVEVGQQNASFAEFDTPRLPEQVGPGATDAAAAAALGLEPADIGFDHHIPSLYSAGVPFAFVPVRSLEALARAHPTPLLTTAALGAPSAFVYARAPRDAAHAYQARNFAPSLGIIEDPATGGAAAAFAGVAARFDTLDQGLTTAPILQGVEMGRPSLIGLEIEIDQGAVARVRISGHAVKVSEGRIDI